MIAADTAAEVEFEIEGTLSDAAITALAAMLLAIVDEEAT